MMHCVRKLLSDLSLNKHELEMNIAWKDNTNRTNHNEAKYLKNMIP